MRSVAEEDQLTRILGGQAEEKLLNSFFVLYKTARLVEENNATYIRQVDHLFAQLKATMEEEGDLQIKIISGRYFINERLIRFDDQGLSGAASVVAEWKTLGVGGLLLKEGIERQELEKFVKFMSQVKPNSANVESLAESLKQSKLKNVELLAEVIEDEDHPLLPEEIRRQLRAVARRTFFKAMSVVNDVVAAAEEGKDINISKTKRVVHSLIDHIAQDESSLIELTAIKNFDSYTYAHSTNVSIYSLTIGIRLGMDRPRLSQLGFSALFHDVGKSKLSSDLINKPAAFDENDWLQMQKHPNLGAKTILRNMKLEAHTARAARGAFEHHINHDLTGYPKLHYAKRKPNLFSRIITIVDTFDALTSGRVYMPKPIRPDEVLKKMQYQMGGKFDPFLLRLFTKIVGVYPSGSLVLLSTDELALVLTNNEQNRSRPYVKVVGNRNGLLPTAEWADLSLPENAHRSIVRLVDPERYNLDIRQFVLRD